jgi:hypothetical protein
MAYTLHFCEFGGGAQIGGITARFQKRRCLFLPWFQAQPLSTIILKRAVGFEKIL